MQKLDHDWHPWKNHLPCCKISRRKGHLKMFSIKFNEKLALAERDRGSIPPFRTWGKYMNPKQCQKIKCNE